MKILIVDGSGPHPDTAARALGAAFHAMEHGVIVHPWKTPPGGLLRGFSARREARKIVRLLEPDVVHVIGAEPWLVESFGGLGVPIVHAGLDKPSRADWLVAPSQAALDRMAQGSAGDRRAACLPYPIEIFEDEPTEGSFALACFDPRDAEARRWAEEAAALTPDIPVRTEGDPADARVVLWLSSRADSWPRGIAEAMAAARPVIATWAGAAPEFVLEGVTGFLSKPGDLQSFAGHLEYLWSRPEDALQMGQAGRDEARQHFGGDVHAKTVLRWYLRAGFSRLAV